MAVDDELSLLLAELERKEAPRPFIDTLAPSIVRYRYVSAICDALEQTFTRQRRAVMIFAPPRLGKSTIVAREFTAEWLSRFPTEQVVLGSYAARLAQTHSMAAQTAFLRRGGTLKQGQAEKHDWQTSAGGGMYAVGIGSGLTGRGADLMVLDDSVKDAEEAASDAIMLRNREWYDSTWSTRLHPGGVKVVITTRWPGKADLSTYALEQESNGQPEEWLIVPLDAVRDPEPWDFPATCTIAPDWRAPGELLCPERVPMEAVLKAKARSGFFYSALYQQRPKARDGVLFKWADWPVVDALPNVADLVTIVRYWDMAGTEVRDTNDPDATSGTLMAKHRDGSFWTLDRATITASVSRRDAFIKQTADADRAKFGGKVVQWLEEQAGIGGHDAMQSLVRLLAGHRVQSERATGDKMTRAEPHASQVQVGNVKLVKGPWNDAYRLQLTGFPFAAHDDDVDSSSGAFNKCAGETPKIITQTTFTR